MADRRLPRKSKNALLINEACSVAKLAITHTHSFQPQHCAPIFNAFFEFARRQRALHSVNTVGQIPHVLIACARPMSFSPALSYCPLCALVREWHLLKLSVCSISKVF
jgi:hypothetical protein